MCSVLPGLGVGLRGCGLRVLVIGSGGCEGRQILCSI